MGNCTGVDWAGEKHDVRVGDEAGEELLAATFVHDEKGLRALCRTMLRLKVELVAIERPDGLLVERLLDAGLQGGKALYTQASEGVPPRFQGYIGGDVITALNGTPTPDVAALTSQTARFGAGQTVGVTVVPCSGPQQTLPVNLMKKTAAQAVNTLSVAASDPSYTPTPASDMNVEVATGNTRDLVLATVGVPAYEYSSTCFAVWLARSNPHFATYETSGVQACAPIAAMYGAGMTVLELEPAGDWRKLFVSAGPNTTCADAPGVPASVAADFAGCPYQQ
jgi:hypothetical protein